VPIHYRCRCGQEVVLRPREGVYIVVGALVGLTLLNTALLLFLYGKLEEGSEPKPPVAERASIEGDPAPSPQGSAGADAGASTPPPLANAPAAVVPPPDSAAPAVPSHGSVALPTSGGASSEPELPAAPAEIVLPPPEGLDPARLPLLLQSSAPGSLDRTLILLAACRWGEDLAPRAADLLRAESPLLFEAITPGDPADASLRLRRPVQGGAKGELAALAQVWQGRWSQILSRADADPSLEWGRALADAGDRAPVDLVLLVDLSESMAEEIEAARVALREMIPALLAARPGWRIGWIGYRDEVVDREPLHAESESFIASLERWRTEAGGDVPEALDEALFEAFRLGAFPWRAGASHRFVVFGDAPPPYERIPGMVELARAAHESPERFEVRCLGILREEEFPEVPGFRALAGAGGGSCIFLPEGMASGSAWWRLLAGEDAPRWPEGSSRRP